MEEITKIKQGENYFGLNHFILWCKGWYVLNPRLTEQYKDDDEKCLIETLKRVLYLDYYNIYDKNDIMNILLNNLEKYNEWAIKNNEKYLSASQLIRNINHNTNVSFKELSYFECVVYAIRDFFAYDNLTELYTPIYSKSLFRMGLTSSVYKHGETYRELNKKARKCKFDVTEEYVKATNKRIKEYFGY